MGEPSQEQIDEAIEQAFFEGCSVEELDRRVMELSRLSDEELAAMDVVPPGEVPAAAPSNPAPAAPSEAGAPTTARCRRSATSAQMESPPDAATVPSILDFAPAPLRQRHDGWTADKQRVFIAALAETGCVSEACAEVRITARSAYRLREHPDAAAFRAAWDHAQSMASVRLTALAFERAIHGTPDRIYKDGELVAERRRPSDRLLMWLLGHHDPVGYGWAARPPAHAPDLSFFRVQHARAELGGQLDQLADVPLADCPAERLACTDYDPIDLDPGA